VKRGALLLAGLVVSAIGASRSARASSVTPPPADAADSVRHLVPGARWTLAVPLSNPSSRAVTFRIAVRAPSGWSIAGARDTVTIRARGRDLAFISLSVGRTVPAGESVVHYEVSDDHGGVRRDSVRCVIGERRELSILATAPAVAATGSRYLARFVVTNRGNTARAYDVRLVSAVPALLDGPASRTIAAGGIDTVDVEARVPAAAPTGGTAAITVRLRPAVVNPAERLSAFVQTTIFVTGGDDPWVRLPVQITPSVAGREGGLAIESKGPLGRGNTQLDLELRGPRRPTSIAGAGDEYRLALTSTRWQVRLGDQPVRLTPLTENGRVATGASVAYTGRVWSAGLGDVITRQFGEATHLSAQFGTIGVQLPGSLRLQGTALVREGRADSGAVGGLQLRWSPSSRHVVEVEGDRARRGGLAWRARVGTSMRRMQLSAAVLDADTAFPGYTRGTRSIEGSGRLQLSTRLWVRASGQDRSTAGGLLFGRDIANPDTLLAHEPLTEHRYRNATLDVGVTRALRIEGRWRRRDDPLGAGAVWGAERILALSSTIGPQLLRVSPRIEVGEATSSLSEAPLPLRRASVDLRLALGRWGAFSSSAGLDLGRSMYDTTARRSWHAGAQLELQAASTRATIGGQYGLSTVAGPWTPPAPSRRVDASIIHELGTGDQLLARVRWDPQARQRVGSDTRVELGYRLRLRVPVAHPQNSGWVRGRIQLDDEGTGVRGVMVRLDDRLAMTGERGEFQFSGVTAGPHVFDVDNRTLGEGRLVRDSALRTIQVADGRETNIVLTAVKGGRISGRLLWYDRAAARILQPGDSLGGGALVMRSSTPELSVLLRSGSRAVRVTTDSTGHFGGEGLEPGEWEIALEPSDLPSTHRMQSDVVKVVVPAGDSTTAELRVLPRLRTVHVLAAPAVPASSASPPRVAPSVEAPTRRRDVPLRPAPRPPKPVVRDVPLLPGSAAPVTCPWPVVRPNGPICQEPPPTNSTANPPRP
jgi:hypothetical protein